MPFGAGWSGSPCRRMAFRVRWGCSSRRLIDGDMRSTHLPTCRLPLLPSMSATMSTPMSARARALATLPPAHRQNPARVADQVRSPARAGPAREPAGAGSGAHLAPLARPRRAEGRSGGVVPGGAICLCPAPATCRRAGTPLRAAPRPRHDAISHAFAKAASDPLHAHADASATGLRCAVDIDPKAQPMLRFSWRVDGLPSQASVAELESDDSPARGAGLRRRCGPPEPARAPAVDQVELSTGHRLPYATLMYV